MVATANSATLARGNASNWYGTQIWYRVAENSTLTFNVTSSTAGKITVNGTQYTLVADTPQDVTVTTASNLSLQLGSADGGPLPAGTFTISDFSVTPAN